MATLSIVKRGKSFHVKYRLGGRAYPLEHCGAFKSKKEASELRNLIAGEIASGLNPKLLLTAMANPPAPVKVETVEQVAERYEASRIDYALETVKNLKSHLRRIVTMF